MAYAPLTSDPSSEMNEDYSLPRKSSSSPVRIGFKILAFPLALIIGALLGMAFATKYQAHEGAVCTLTTGSSERLLYSPAQDAVRYKVHRFNASFRTDITQYQGTPTPEIDKNWENLYRYGVNQISASEASKLVDKTVPIPGDTESYIVTLEVFHQIHCLNLLRKSLYPDYYSSALVNHLDHCIDILRQALTCTVDINPLSWEWYEPRHATETKLDGAHQCVDFEKIQEWAYEHRLKMAFDDSVNLKLGHETHHHDA